MRIVDFEGEGGFPSTVELPDAHVLTAYYVYASKTYAAFHTGVVTGAPPEQ